MHYDLHVPLVLLYKRCRTESPYTGWFSTSWNTLLPQADVWFRWLWYILRVPPMVLAGENWSQSVMFVSQTLWLKCLQINIIHKVIWWRFLFGFAVCGVDITRRSLARSIWVNFIAERPTERARFTRKLVLFWCLLSARFSHRVARFAKLDCIWFILQSQRFWVSGCARFVWIVVVWRR